MRKKVIVVEDDLMTARYIELCLRRLGYQDVRIATSSAMAFEMVREQVPDLVLMDIEIEVGTDGVEIATALRKQFNVPSIFLTGRTDEITLARAKRAEPLGYLVKPVKAEELRSAITIGMYNERLTRESKERELRALQGSEPEVRRLRAELALQATHDEATGLLNSRGWSLVGEHQLRLMRRLRSAASLVCLELLNLREIDKEFGGGATMQALKDLATALHGVQRDGVLSARLDTEHFVLLAPGANSAELSERISAAIDGHNTLTARPWKLELRCSDAHSSPKSEITIHELLRQADGSARQIDAG